MLSKDLPVFRLCSQTASVMPCVNRAMCTEPAANRLMLCPLCVRRALCSYITTSWSQQLLTTFLSTKVNETRRTQSFNSLSYIQTSLCQRPQRMMKLYRPNWQGHDPACCVPTGGRRGDVERRGSRTTAWSTESCPCLNQFPFLLTPQK